MIEEQKHTYWTLEMKSKWHDMYYRTLSLSMNVYLAKMSKECMPILELSTDEGAWTNNKIIHIGTGDLKITNEKEMMMWENFLLGHLSWEAVYRKYHLGDKTDLREIVSAVGGDVALRHGIVLAKSIPAKKYRIQTGETIFEAKQKCPELVLVPPNYNLYEKCSKAFIEILKCYSPSVEQYSIDEAVMDMTGTESLWGNPQKAADRIREEIRDTLGFTVNIGISENKLLAKMASDFQKPDMTHTLWKNEIETKMWPLPVSDIWGKNMNRLVNDFIKELAQKLKIQIPKVYYDTRHFANNTMLAQCEPDENVIYITPFLKATPDIIFAIAHELRHMWQIQYHPNEYMINHKTVDTIDFEQFNLQPAEIDANAFAYIVMMDFFKMRPSFDNLSQNVINKILERANQIELETE